MIILRMAPTSLILLQAGRAPRVVGRRAAPAAQHVPRVARHVARVAEVRRAGEDHVARPAQAAPDAWYATVLQKCCIAYERSLQTNMHECRAMKRQVPAMFFSAHSDTQGEGCGHQQAEKLALCRAGNASVMSTAGGWRTSSSGTQTAAECPAGTGGGRSGRSLAGGT